jgi:hypothetical protein
MARKEYSAKESSAKEPNVKETMTIEEARAYRVSQYKPKAPVLSDREKREKFRIFWAQERAKYGKPKNLEEILWTHLTAAKLNAPEKFEEGIKHFGLKKLGN